MANMRVHELAKELNISSKEIIETLSNDTKKYTASNGLTDSEITSIRSKFGKKAAQPEKPKTEAKQEDKIFHRCIFHRIVQKHREMIQEREIRIRQRTIIR